ncbi:MAG: hypothetical protein K6F61_04170 [Clostridiales bacterium]|nr:hypothetical protein [Clostridiales bacterium]
MGKMNMKVNKELPLGKLITLIDRVDSLQKATVAKRWVKQNTVISEEKRMALLGKIALVEAKLYIELAKSVKKPVINMAEVNKKAFFDSVGVRELKVG